jgi:hypothetical protein
LVGWCHPRNPSRRFIARAAIFSRRFIRRPRTFARTRLVLTAAAGACAVFFRMRDSESRRSARRGYTAMQIATIVGENKVKVVPDIAVSGDGSSGLVNGGIAHALLCAYDFVSGVRLIRRAWGLTREFART